MNLKEQTVYIPKLFSPNQINGVVDDYIDFAFVDKEQLICLSKDELIELIKTVYFGGIEGFIVKDGGFDGWLQRNFPELNNNSKPNT